ncbi:MAG: hypothetical protein P4L71_18260 [Acetobacteraceae bacterium]|nr:hypothetical protein [Acetobacteraceae bacterium]
MAALPPLLYLHRYALPAHFLADLDIAPRPDRLARGPASVTRPHLVATWEIGPQGRPVCRWSVERTSCIPSG